MNSSQMDANGVAVADSLEVPALRTITTTTHMKTSHSALLLAILLTRCGSPIANSEVVPCLSPNLTATVQGQADFKACGAYAYTAMGYFSVIGQSGNSWITMTLFTKDRSALVPGTYAITNGIIVPEGQAFGCGLGYKEGSSDLEHTFSSRSGTLELSAVDGDHYKGSFTVSCTRVKGEKDARELSGSFDVMFDPARAVGMH